MDVHKRQCQVANYISDPQKEGNVDNLHPVIRKLTQSASAGAVRTALGSDQGISNILDEYAGLRLSVSVDGSALNPLWRRHLVFQNQNDWL